MLPAVCRFTSLIQNTPHVLHNVQYLCGEGTINKLQTCTQLELIQIYFYGHDLLINCQESGITTAVQPQTTD